MKPKEQLNWWWFLLFGGILIPAVFVLLLKTDVEYFYLRPHHIIITGLNPYIPHILNFLFLFLICIVFKTLATVNYNNMRVIYFMLCALVLFYCFQSAVIHKDLNARAGIINRYIDFSPQKQAELNNYFPLLPGVLIVCLFVFFCIMNYPKKLAPAEY